MEYNFHFNPEFAEELHQKAKELIYQNYLTKKMVDPLEKLPEEELVSEDEFITMMTGR